MGRVVSQVDAPFSEANSIAFWSVGGSEFFKVVDVLLLSTVFFGFTLQLFLHRMSVRWRLGALPCT